MIVVVIIGILAAVAVPSYQGFQEKARSSEAKVALSQIYVGEKAYFAENEDYTNDLVKAGVDSFGVLKYFNVGFGQSPIPTLTSCILKKAVNITDCSASEHFSTAQYIGPSVNLQTPGNPGTFRASAGRVEGNNLKTISDKKNYSIDQNRNLVGPL